MHPSRRVAAKSGTKKTVFRVERHEQARYTRIKKLLDAFGRYTDRRASVLLDLSDDQTPNDGPWPKLKEAALPLSAGMRTAQLMTRCAAREGNRSGKVDRSYDQMLWMALKKKAAYLPGC